MRQAVPRSGYPAAAETAAFRDAYRAENVRESYSGWGHFRAIFGGYGAVFLLCLLLLDRVSGWEWAVPPVTFIYANLSEYFGHRFAMHRRVPGLSLIHKRHVKQHHRFFLNDDLAMESPDDFKAVLFPAYLTAFFFIAFSLPAALLLAWLWSDDAALLFLATSLAYYLVYEAAHFICHLSDDSAALRIPGMKRLVTHHRLHHRADLMARANFNFMFPLGDWIFGPRRAGEN